MQYLGPVMYPLEATFLPDPYMSQQVPVDGAKTKKSQLTWVWQLLWQASGLAYPVDTTTDVNVVTFFTAVAI